MHSYQRVEKDDVADISREDNNVFRSLAMLPAKMNKKADIILISIVVAIVVLLITMTLLTSQDKIKQENTHNTSTFEANPTISNLYLNSLLSSQFNSSIIENDTTFDRIERLPDEIKPLHYEIDLQPNYQQLYIIGRSKIEILCLNRTDRIVLHKKDIDIQRMAVYGNGLKYHILHVQQDLKNELFHIQLDHHLIGGHHYQLHLWFKSQIVVNRRYGFYRSYYQNRSKQTRYLYVTQLSPTDARMVFPCFDEPSMKSTFKLSITCLPGYSALSNMPVQSYSILPNGHTLVSFATTVKMSTYLVGFVVSDFENLARYSSNGILVRTWTSKENIKQTQDALKLATAYISLFSNLFNITFPLPKLDLVAIPDFAVAGMENWGLITIMQDKLLCDMRYCSMRNYASTASVLAHEIAHQWFGNLVTMKWWNDLWLKEGFATFASQLGCKFMNRDLNLCRFIVSAAHENAMQFDSSIYSHPIHQPIESQINIKSQFDSISYRKAASLIRMLYHYIGPSSFVQGIQKFLRKYEYGNANNHDLWRSFTEVNNLINVGEVMDTWIYQKNYPLLTMKIKSNMVNISQSPFMEGRVHTSRARWLIPFCYMTENGFIQRKLIDLNGSMIPLPPSTSWIKGNCNRTGIYRINYEIDLWQKFVDLLQQQPQYFSSHDRANLLDDSYYLSRVDLLNVEIFLNMTRYLIAEHDYEAFNMGILRLKFLVSILDEPFKQKAKKFILYLLRSNLYQNNQVDEYDINKIMMKVLVLRMASWAEYKPVLYQIKRAFQRWLHGYSLSPNLVPAIVEIGVSIGDEDDWNRVLKRYYEVDDDHSKRLCMKGLAASKNPKLLKRLLEIIMDEKQVKPDQTVQILDLIAKNPVGTDLVWKFITSHWDQFYNRYGKEIFSMPKLISLSICQMKTEMQLQNVELFFSYNKRLQNYKRLAEMEIERLRLKIRWIHRHQQQVQSWFRNICRELKL